MKISIIPQDVSGFPRNEHAYWQVWGQPLIFSGTVRTVLDPFGLYDDAQLWDALRRSSLASFPNTSGDKVSITLDTVIELEGANLSVGERSLLSLARALVKNSKVVILDEAT